MSFLEISLSYVYAKPKSRMSVALSQADRLVESADTLPFAKRKAILKINLLLLAGLAVFYIFLTGSIVSGGLSKIEKMKKLESVSRELDYAQAGILSLGTGLTMGAFEEKGFIETINMSVIKRTNNVASKAEFSTYQ